VILSQNSLRGHSQYASALGLDADFECFGSTLDVERIPQPAAALFGFEFPVGDIACCRFQPYSTRLIDAYPSAGG
jgi:hypothetical protein